ncbi:hypothetical protein HK100_004958 [Physocladia obscura]|uniref:Uncharacterized protein n=1 Tax=Physocladia obscura TaxID=109957 RepID=A0AAD5T5Z6_9FUNG|nr:hypothetical protein HK100_004958 [Physocladia obscura]
MLTSTASTALDSASDAVVLSSSLLNLDLDALPNQSVALDEETFPAVLKEPGDSTESDESKEAKEPEGSEESHDPEVPETGRESGFEFRLKPGQEFGQELERETAFETYETRTWNDVSLRRSLSLSLRARTSSVSNNIGNANNTGSNRISLNSIAPTPNTAVAKAAKRSSVFSVSSTTAFVDYLSDLFKALPGGAESPAKNSAAVPLQFDLSSQPSPQSPRISLTQFGPYSPTKKPSNSSSLSTDFFQSGNAFSNSSISGNTIANINTHNLNHSMNTNNYVKDSNKYARDNSNDIAGNSNRESERIATYQQSQLRKYRPYPIVRSTSSSSSRRHRVTFSSTRVLRSSNRFSHGDMGKYSVDISREVESTSELNSRVNSKNSVTGIDAVITSYEDNQEHEVDEEERGEEVEVGGTEEQEEEREEEEEEDEDEEEEEEEGNKSNVPPQNDGWKSFIEWRDGIENASQENADGIEEEEFRSTEQLQSESSRESDNFSVFTTTKKRIAKNGKGNIQTVGGENVVTTSSTNATNSTISFAATDSELSSIVINALQERSSTVNETIPSLNVSRLQEFLSAVNPFHQLKVTSRKSAPVLDVTRTASNGQFVARNRAQANTNQIPTPIWQGVPLTYFKNGLYWSVATASHSFSRRVSDADSLKLLNFGMGSEFTGYEVTLKVT